MDSLDQFWARMLSGDPARIRPAWDSLSAEEQAAVRAQLGRMRAEGGWHATQRDSAETALHTIDSLGPHS